jgi:AAA ATPase domain/AAA domain, putative AbiEii toxin, Type IV TA system
VQLISAHVTNYRSVEDSDEFEVDPEVTCLVGKNESGKTAALQALYRFNPVESTARYDEVVDLPVRLTRRRNDWGPKQLVPVVMATFRLTEEEVVRVEAALGAAALKSHEITLTTGYRSKGRHWRVDYDEAAMLAHLVGGLEVPSEILQKLEGAASFAELTATIKDLESKTAAVTELLERLEGWSEDAFECVVDVLPHPPKFVYFDDYDSMPGKVSIPDLIARRDQGVLGRGELALLSLLRMAGAGLADFHEPDKHERLIRRLENAGAAISDEVFQYWSQNDQLAVKLEVLQPEPGAAPPLHVGPILQVRVLNHRHRASVSFDERSRGFVWFFSFLAYFDELERDADGDLILLLDEPGLSLHGRAQEDLLRLIDERLAPKHQVIYTTHSPFMVSPSHLNRVRTVIDRDKVGTKISAEIFKADEDTAAPLLTAMGIEMTQTLFIGEHTLLLEGPSDLIYLDVFSDVLESQGQTGLDPRWVKTPIGGSGKLSTFATLLGANRIDVAVLVDSSTKDVGAIKRLRDNGQLSTNGLVEVKEFTGTADADIEDLFEPGFYLELVNAAYTKELAAPITGADLNPHDPRIVRQVEAYFVARNVAGGKFNHYRPAAFLLREQATLIPRISSATLNRAQALISRLNSLLT